MPDSTTRKPTYQMFDHTFRHFYADKIQRAGAGKQNFFEKYCWNQKYMVWFICTFWVIINKKVKLQGVLYAIYTQQLPIVT